MDSRARKALEHGVVLEEGRTAPAKIGRVVFDSGANTTNFSFTLAEGRNRQIRRSLLTLGRPVKKLVRVRMGPLRLGTLARGKARRLRRDEVAELHAHARALSTRRRKPRAK